MTDGTSETECRDNERGINNSDKLKCIEHKICLKNGIEIECLK